MGKRKKVTTRDIAEALGVSQSTVSMILSEKPRVSFSQDTVDKVRAMAEQMGYAEQVPDVSRKSKALANTIIAICPNLSGGYYSMLLHSIIEQANQHKYTVLTVTTLRDARIEHIYLDLLARNQLAGIIVLYPMAQIPKLNELAGKVPVISIGDKPGSYHFDAVVLDSKKPAMMIAEHLLSLGHTHLAYVTTPVHGQEVGRIRRLAGIRQCLEEHGLPEDHLEILSTSRKEFAKYPGDRAEYQNGYDRTIEALQNGTASTAFIGNNDMTALGIMDAITKLGYKIPFDYSVCGFDNIPLASMKQISLTTIEHATVQKGHEAVDLIHKKHSQDHSGRQPSYTVRLEYEPQLIVRNSAGKCRKNLR